jgi:hypothetical protein
MKKTIVLFLSMVICAHQMMAQKETKKFSVGFGIEAGSPVGSYQNAYTFGAGLTVRFSYHVGPGFVCLTSGLIGLAPKKVVDQPTKAAIQIPVRVGYKYIIHNHFFMMGEFGYVNTKSYYASGGKLQSVSGSSFVVAPSIGVQWNSFEISLRYDINFKDQGGIIGPRIGFNF